MRNGINKTITEENCSFDHVLGTGSAKEIADMIRCRFNMDGSDPEGRKVGLLDKHHIWCFLCDPFNYEWRSTFKIEGTLRRHVLDMVEHFIPLDNDGAPTSRERITKEFEVR